MTKFPRGPFFPILGLVVLILGGVLASPIRNSSAPGAASFTQGRATPAPRLPNRSFAVQRALSRQRSPWPVATPLDPAVTSGAAAASDLFSPQPFAVPQTTSGLVGYWKFDEGSGSTAGDSSGNNLSGTLVNGPTWTTGIVNTALNFNSSAQSYVQVGAQPALIMSSGTTLAAWVNTAGSPTGQNQTILSKEGEYILGISPGGTIEWALSNTTPGWNWFDTGYHLPLNQWTHIAITYDGASANTYANGNFVSSTAASGAIGDSDPAENDFRIGSRQCSFCVEYFNGGIDEVRVYNRALSQSEVQGLTTAPPSISITSPANGATFTAPASFTINASVNANTFGATINKVKFFQNGVLVNTVFNPGPYNYAVSNLATGNYQFWATAIDSLGQATQSAPINVTVSPIPPPSVNITSPADGATFTAPASFNVTANATAGAGASINKVKFFQNGVLVSTVLNPGPYIYNAANLAAGSYQFMATAIDSLGQATQSALINVTVTSIPAPSVNITSPADGTTFTAPASFNVTANATAGAGASINKVKFFQNGVLVGTVFNPGPYIYNASNLAVGSYQFWATAVDNLGQATQSAVVNVTVSPIPPPSVNLTSPANGATFTAPASFNVTANATAAAGASINKVKFFQNGVLVSTVFNPGPYTYAASNLAVGSYQFWATAVDNLGQATQSAVVNVTVTISNPANDVVWVEDALPAGAATAGDFEGWNWISANPTPFSGSLSHQSNIVAGEHQHYFFGATNTLSINAGDTLVAYVYLDPGNLPSEVMLQWSDGVSWDHRAFWGSDSIGFGAPGTVAHVAMGSLPASGQWVRLEVPAGTVGLGGSVVSGMAFTLFNGRATWDHAGKSTANAGPSVSITSPANGATFTAPASFNVTANATAAAGATINKVQFFQNGVLVSTVLNPGPYTYAASNLAAGSYQFTATAIDSLGQATQSAPVNVTVNSAPSRNYQGYLDVANCSIVGGWAWDSNQPNTPISVDIYDNNNQIATVVANVFRQDLLNAGIGNGNHGFNLVTPASLKDGQTHTVFAKFSGTTINLSTTPKSVNCAAIGPPPPDLTANQIGRLTSMGNPGSGTGQARIFYAYDALGRTTGTVHKFEGNSYVNLTSYGYPQNSVPLLTGPGSVATSQTLPDSEVVNYAYDAGGAQQSIKTTPNGGPQQTIVSGVLRNARGQTTAATYGNGAISVHKYNEATDLRLNQIQTAVGATLTVVGGVPQLSGGTTLQNYVYSFDNNGNVTSVTDNVTASLTATYTYDSLDELTSMTVPSTAQTFQYTYDAVGNLKNKEGTIQTYGGAQSCVGCSPSRGPHALATSNGITHNYDANGNLISTSSGTSINWNAENMPFQVVQNNVTQNQKFFLGESLWKKIEPSVTTYYLPSMRIENGQVRKFFGGFAERSPDGALRFYHNDHLGSASLVTDAAGAVLRSQSYMPYGDDRVVTGGFTPKYQFNFKERESTGFYDYGARLYNPATGRWLSADSNMADGLNRYAYTTNNPLRYVDPTGHQQRDSAAGPVEPTVAWQAMWVIADLYKLDGTKLRSDRFFLHKGDIYASSGRYRVGDGVYVRRVWVDTWQGSDPPAVMREGGKVINVQVPVNVGLAVAVKYDTHMRRFYVVPSVGWSFKGVFTGGSVLKKLERLGSRVLKAEVTLEDEPPSEELETKVSVSTPWGKYENGKWNRGYTNPAEWFSPSLELDLDIFHQLRNHPFSDQSGPHPGPF